jgi:hypothetical protein
MNEEKKKVVPAYPRDDDGDLISPSVSATDCTGLMSIPPEDEDAAESYLKLYDIPAAKGVSGPERQDD